MTSARAHTALMAIAISVLPERQGQRLSSRMIQAFTDNARAAGFPADGEYVFPGGLATLTVRDGVGVHVEPNVWVLHRVE